MLGRRGALFGLLAAPMIVRTPGLLMPVRRVRYPWLMNREMRDAVDITAMCDRNVLLARPDLFALMINGMEKNKIDTAIRPPLRAEWRGVPIYVRAASV